MISQYCDSDSSDSDAIPQDEESSDDQWEEEGEEAMEVSDIREEKSDEDS